MYCPFCGKRNLKGDRYCAFCGKRLPDDQPGHSCSRWGPRPSDESGKEKSYGDRIRHVPVCRYGMGIVLFFVEIAVMVVLLALFLILSQTVYSPKHVAEKYVKVKASQDWNALYDMVFIEETNEFQNKQAYVTAREIQQGEGEASKAKIEDTRLKATEADTRSYLVSYEEDGETLETEVTVIKKNLKWKVQENLDIVKKFQIAVPKGTSLTVDKILVPSKMKTFYNNSSEDLYTITKVFGPTHYVEVEGDGFEPVACLVTAQENGEIIHVKAGYTQELKEKAAQEAFADLNTILTGAADDKNFGSIPLLKGLDSKKKNELREAYLKIKNEIFENDNKGRDLIDYSLTDCTAQVKAGASGGRNLVRVKIKGNCSMKFVNYRRWRADIETESETCAYVFKYVNENGSFSLYSATFHFPGEEEEE